MDTDGNARLTLEALKASAPRSFDKQIIELLAAVQDGARPIVTSTPAPAPRYDDTPLRAEIMRLESALSEARMRLDQVIALAKQQEADLVRLESICRALDGRISSVSLKEAA